MAAARRCAAVQGNVEAPQEVAVLTLALDRAARAVRQIVVLEQQCRGVRPMPHARAASGAAPPAGRQVDRYGRSTQARGWSGGSWSNRDWDDRETGEYSDEAVRERLTAMFDRLAENQNVYADLFGDPDAGPHAAPAAAPDDHGLRPGPVAAQGPSTPYPPSPYPPTPNTSAQDPNTLGPSTPGRPPQGQSVQSPSIGGPSTLDRSALDRSARLAAPQGQDARGLAAGPRAEAGGWHGRGRWSPPGATGPPAAAPPQRG